MPARATTATAAPARAFAVNNGMVFDGLVAFEYPHIPTQWFPVQAADSVFAMDLRFPATLRVAFIRANRNDQLDARLSEMGVEVIPIDPLALAVADLSIYSTILIAPRAYAEVEALQANAAVVRRFAEHGGTVVVLFGRDELLLPGVLPYPVTFSPFATRRRSRALDPRAPVRLLAPRSSLLEWPNKITSSDFENWSGMRARELPATFDAHYQRADRTERRQRSPDGGGHSLRSRRKRDVHLHGLGARPATHRDEHRRGAAAGESALGVVAAEAVGSSSKRC